jgi:hypothetical protein
LLLWGIAAREKIYLIINSFTVPSRL